MIKPALPPSEKKRLNELLRYEVLDTLPEKQFDDITFIASQICGAPIALVSLLDETRQWFKASTGLESKETSREISFCGHAILNSNILEIEDALDDPRFVKNPLVLGAPKIRFYAGAPLTTPSGENLGTLCVIDHQPRKLTELQLKALSALADQTVALLEMRLSQRNLRDATNAKSQFLANMSHEIRTPLGAILGFSEVMRDPDLKAAEREKYLNIVDRNGRVLSRLIDDILDLSKVEAKQLSVEMVAFDVRETAREVLQTFSKIAAEKSVRLELSIEDHVPDRIETDPFRVRQILTNIVGNAVKFTHHGQVELTVSFTETTSDAHSILQFKVRDTGIGIAPEHAKLLFKPFGQAETSTPRNYGGTGLGLYLTRELCELLGGSLDLETSQPGVGTTFVAFVRASCVKTATAAPKLARVDSLSSFDLSKKRLLLVDDSEDNQALMSIFLKKSGAEIVIAENGAQGVELALTSGFDAILMDIEMPVMNGVEATKALRARGFTKPIIALTAHAMTEFQKTAKEAGFTDHLPKPITKDRLLSLLAKLSS